MNASITRTALTTTFAAVLCFVAATSASAQSICPVTGQPIYGQPATGQPVSAQPAYGQPAHGQPAFGHPHQPAVAPSPYVNPNPGPSAGYFLGVYTQTTTFHMPGGVGPVAAPVNGPAAMMVPAITPQPQLRTGQRVTSVVPGSPAARAGLEIGDILVLGNGQPLTSKGALINAINYSNGFLQLSVRDIRTGQIRPLHAQPTPKGAPVAYANR